MRQRSDRVHEMNLVGYVFPWEDGQPVLANMEGSDDRFLLVFSTPDKLDETLNTYGIGYESIKQIDDPEEFIESIMYESPRIRIAVDATMKGDVCHFVEIIRPPLT